jgi:branched-chain amino acid transport system permease protein
MADPIPSPRKTRSAVRRIATFAVSVVLIALAAIVPWIGGPYYVSVLFFLFLSIALTETYDIPAGYMGYINLGHGAFYGIGAYAYAMTLTFGGHGFLGLALAAIAPTVFAALISFPLFRLRDAYFAIATFGVLKLMEVLVSNLRDLTGGTTGLSIPPTDSVTITYYLALALAVAAVALNAYVASSKLGLAFLTIREDEEVAETSGVDTARLKRYALILSAMLPGLAGAVYVWQTTYIDPDSGFGSAIAFAPVIMAMLGGSGTVLGPLLGALFITAIQEFLWSHVGYLQLSMYGVILVVVGILMPGGLLRSRLLSKIYALLRIPGHYGYQPARLPHPTAEPAAPKTEG